MYICDGLVLNLPPENKPWNVINNIMKYTHIFILTLLIITSCNNNDDSEGNTTVGEEIRIKNQMDIAEILKGEITND